MTSPTLKAFIFDMDGTLVDSFLDFDAMREELNFPQGVPLLEHIESLGDSITPMERDSYFDVINRHELEGAKRSLMMEGCKEFLNFLEDRGIKTGVLTRNSLHVTEETFKKWDLDFEVTLTRDCVVQPKPHPEGLLKICEELSILPEESVYMGDYLFDLTAAKNAGMKAILYSPLENPEFEKEADFTVRSYFQLIEKFEEEFLRSLSFTF